MKKTLGLLKALADGNRLRVVFALLENKELCVCVLTEMLGITMASVSRHMSILQAAGVVTSRKEGRWVHYRLEKEFPSVLRKWLAANLSDDPALRKDRKAVSIIRECREAVTPRSGRST